MKICFPKLIHNILELNYFQLTSFDILHSRPPRQASPSVISTLPNNPSVISAHPPHTTTLPALRTIPTSSTTINSGRFHQVPHLFTSGLNIYWNICLAISIPWHRFCIDGLTNWKVKSNRWIRLNFMGSLTTEIG